MKIDVSKLNQELLDKALEGKSESERNFIKQVELLKEQHAEQIKIEVESVIKKYVDIQAKEILQLYDKHIKSAVEASSD